jgi:hypothetical protein
MKPLGILIGCMICVFVFVIWAAEHDTAGHNERVEALEHNEQVEAPEHNERVEAPEHKERVEPPEDDHGKRRQALALAFEEVMRQQGHEVSVSATNDQLWFDCGTALEPRSSCYAAYQSSKHLPSDLREELRAVGITTLNFSPNGEMIPKWAININ